MTDECKQKIWEMHLKNSDNTHELKNHFCRSCIDMATLAENKRVLDEIDAYVKGNKWRNGMIVSQPLENRIASLRLKDGMQLAEIGEAGKKSA